MFEDTSPAPSVRRYSSVPASARDSSPALAVPPSALLAFCERLAALPRSGTGVLLFGDVETPIGRILFEKGRVCWASAHNMRKRLTDLLCHQHDPPLDRERVEQAYAECVRSRKIFGEHLLECGVVSEHGLRRALRQHIAESMALLSDPAIPARWIGQEQRSYDARLTFSTGELLTNLGALWDLDAAYEATSRLRRVAEPAECVGIGFVVTPAGELLPVAQSYSDNVSALDLVGLGSWVGRLPTSLQHAIEQPHFACYKRADGNTALGWIDGRIGYAVVCSSPSAVSQVLSRILNV